MSAIYFCFVERKHRDVATEAWTQLLQRCRTVEAGARRADNAVRRRGLAMSQMPVTLCAYADMPLPLM
jgi:hypothetical protein